MTTKNKLKIVWLGNYPIETLKNIKLLKPVTSHPSSWIVNLLRELSKNPKLEIHMVTLSPKIKESQVIYENNITFHVVKNGLPYLNRGFPKLFPLNTLSNYRMDIKKLLYVINTINPSFIHAHGTEGPYGITAAKSKYPYVLSIQGIIGEISKLNKDLLGNLKKKLEIKVLKETKYFVCKTDYDSNYVNKINENALIYRIHEAINNSFFKIEREGYEENTLLFVGSLIKAKGIEVLLEAISLIKKKIPNIKVYIVGDGSPSYKKYLEKLISELKINNNIIFKGFLTHSQLIELHRNIQIFVLPTFIDNSPNSLAEAMASGMPIIASHVGGVPSMIENDKNGILVEPGNAKDLANKIIDLISNKEKQSFISKNAKKMAKDRYLPSKVAKEIVNLYHNLH